MHPSEETREILVGMAALLVLSALVGVIVGRQTLFGGESSDTYRIVASFYRVDGLNVGAEVRVAGVPVGTVAALELRPDFRVRMTMRLDARVELPTDSSAAIVTDGLFGTKSVYIEPGGEAEMLSNDGVIEFTQGAVLVTELLDQIIAEGKAVRAGGGGVPPPASGGQ